MNINIYSLGNLVSVKHSERPNVHIPLQMDSPTASVVIRTGAYLHGTREYIVTHGNR